MIQPFIPGPYGVARRGYNAVTRAFHIVSVFAILAIALLVCADVVSRGMFNVPIRGTPEIVANTLVGLVFLQLPFAIMSFSMIQASVLYEAVGRTGEQIIESITCLLGIAICLAIAYGGWNPMWEAIEIGAYEGEGALRVPVWPVRIILVVMSALAAVAYVFTLIDAWVVGPPHDDEHQPQQN